MTSACTAPSHILQLILESAPSNVSFWEWGRVTSEIRSRSEMAQMFLNFPSPLRARGSSFRLLAFFGLISFLQLAKGPGCASTPGQQSQAL